MKKDLGGAAHKLKPNRLATVITFRLQLQLQLQLQPDLVTTPLVELHLHSTCLLTSNNNYGFLTDEKCAYTLLVASTADGDFLPFQQVWSGATACATPF